MNPHRSSGRGLAAHSTGFDAGFTHAGRCRDNTSVDSPYNPAGDRQEEAPWSNTSVATDLRTSSITPSSAAPPASRPRQKKNAKSARALRSRREAKREQSRVRGKQLPQRQARGADQAGRRLAAAVRLGERAVDRIAARGRAGRAVLLHVEGGGDRRCFCIGSQAASAFAWAFIACSRTAAFRRVGRFAGSSPGWAAWRAKVRP